jgi:hypothetical protein
MTKGRSEMASRKAKSPANKAKAPAIKKPNTVLRELFQGVIPMSDEAFVVQEAAKQEGWVPGWEREGQKLQKTTAGKQSGVRRRGLAEMRRAFVKQARMRIGPEHRRAPYSNASLDALSKEYKNLLAKSEENDADPIIGAMQSVLSASDLKSLRQTSRDTLLSDLKAIRKSLGIKRKLERD